MEEKHNSNLDNIKIASFMKKEGYYVDLRNVNLKKEKFPEQKTKINWEKLKEKAKHFVVAVSIVAGIVVAGKLVTNFWEYQDEKIASQFSQEVVHIDTSTPTPKPTSFEDVYLEQQQKELEKVQKNIAKNYYEGDSLMQKITSTNESTKKEVYSAPEFTKVTTDSNIAEYDRTYAGIDIPVNDYENSVIKPGSKYSECEKYLTKELKQKFEKAGDTYGIDPNLLIAIAMQETTLGKDLTNTYAIGIMQIEKELLNEVVKVYNYDTQEFESKKITTDSISGETNNINMGATIFQARSKTSTNYLNVIQTYNYGPEAMNIAKKLASAKTEKPIEELTFDDVYPSIEYIHNHPQETLNINWKFNTYGDKNYAKNVASYLKTNLTYNIVTVEGEPTFFFVYDVLTGNRIKEYVKEGDTFIDPQTNYRYTKEEIVAAINNVSNIMEENKNKNKKTR